MKFLKYFVLSFVVIFTFFGFKNLDVKAGYADNPVIVNYTMANQVYSIPNEFTKNLTQGMVMEQITLQVNKQAQGCMEPKCFKYQVIDVVSTNKKNAHKLGTTQDGKISLEAAGLNAMAVVAPKSKKLWISVAGTASINDAKTALVGASSNNRMGQEVQLMLYINYIYNTYKAYRDYNWYLTGHSLGGNLAVQTYMNVRAGMYLVPNKNKFIHGGAFPKKFSGVYVFNPLPISKSKVTAQQWSENFKGTYNKEVSNFVIKDEWLYAYNYTANYGRSLNDVRTNYIGTVELYASKDANKAKNAASLLPGIAISYKYFDLDKIIREFALYNDLTTLHGRGELNNALSTNYYGAKDKIK